MEMENWEAFFSLLSKFIDRWERGDVRDRELDGMYTKMEHFAGIYPRLRVTGRGGGVERGGRWGERIRGTGPRMDEI